MNPSSAENQNLTPTDPLEYHISDFQQIVGQENNNTITIIQKQTNENPGLTVELPAKRFEPETNIHSATQDTQSNLGSPIRLNFLVEVPSPSLLKATLDPSEDSQSFILGQGSSEPAEANINAKISQILIEPPIIPPRIQLDLLESPEPKISITAPPLLNLNFSLGTEMNLLNLEAPELSESAVESQTQFRRKKKNKNPSRVTFDDSLNIDIIYDPEVPSDQYIKIEKSSETNKKPEFISVYSNRPKSEEEIENKNNTSLKEKRKHELSIEYKPDTSQNDEIETDQNNGLFEGISNSSNEPSELRLSKMSEDQAARVFEARKNDIFEGLKKLNKNRPYNALPKSPPNHVFSNRRNLSNKNESRKALSQSYDENQMKPRVTGLIIENVENKRPKSSQRSERKSWTPQKVSKFLSETDGDKKNDQAKVFNIDLNKKGRSISQQIVKPIEPDYNLIPISSKAQKDRNMIDEMYKLAKEDVQKRIASIEKTLVGTPEPDSSRKVAEKSNPVAQNQLSRASQNTDSTASLRQSQAKRETPEINRKVDEIVVDLKQEKKKANLQPKKESPYSGGLKVTPTKVKTAIYDFEALERQRMKNSSFSVANMEKDPNKSGNKNDQSNSAGKYLSTLESQQLAQDSKGVRSNSKSRSEYDTKPTNPRLSTPKKAINSPPKFAEIEAVVSQRNSYSRMHNEKFKGLFTSPKNQNKSDLMISQSEILKKPEVFSAYDVAKQYTDIKKNLYASTFNKINSRQPQEVSKYKAPNKNEEVKYNEKMATPDKRDEKEVKQYTLRPHPPVDKASSHRKNNSSSILASPPQSESQNKLTKSSLQAEIEKYINMTSPKDNNNNNNKAARSSSVTAMKAAKPQPSPKLQPEQRKLKAYDPFGDMNQLTSPKNLKPMAYALSPTKPSDSNRVEKTNSGRLQITPSQRSANRSPLFDSSRNSNSGTKSEYLKSLFFSQKKEGNSKDQSKSQKSALSKSNFSNSDNVEDMVNNKNSYKFLEIRNNQYVFLNQ